MDPKAVSCETTYKTLDVCRCCCSIIIPANISKDLITGIWSAYKIGIYEDMLKDTFNVQLHQDTRISNLMCADCIKQLQDAHCFKRMIVNSEERFRLQLQMMVEKKEAEFLETKFNIDPIKMDPSPLVVTVGHLHNVSANEEPEMDAIKMEASPMIDSVDNSCGEDFSANEEPEIWDTEFKMNPILDPPPLVDSVDDPCRGESLAKEGIPAVVLQMRQARRARELARAQRKSIPAHKRTRGENTRTRVKKSTSDPRPKTKASLKASQKASQTTSTKSSQKDWLKIAQIRGNGPILRENSLKLISNSTLFVFQWHKSRYRCFCCTEPYSDINQLRNHMNEHNLEDIERKIILQQNRLVKVEVSLLRCKICDREIENLAALRSHLQSHGVIFPSKEDLLVPYRIERDLKCQICNEKSRSFRLLNVHMNRHYKNQVCDVCGASFSSLQFLKGHKKLHRPSSCKTCDLVFPTKSEKREHDVTTHGVIMVKKFRFPCSLCPERFFHEYQRVMHLVEKHGMEKPVNKCTLCDKEFLTKSFLNGHVKNVHMKEKKHACDACDMVFYTKSDLTRHKVTHTGEKNFSCDLCSTLFATKDSLRRHTKRTHRVV